MAQLTKTLEWGISLTEYEQGGWGATRGRTFEPPYSMQKRFATANGWDAEAAFDEIASVYIDLLKANFDILRLVPLAKKDLAGKDIFKPEAQAQLKGAIYNAIQFACLNKNVFERVTGAGVSATTFSVNVETTGWIFSSSAWGHIAWAMIKGSEIDKYEMDEHGNIHFNGIEPNTLLANTWTTNDELLAKIDEYITLNSGGIKWLEDKYADMTEFGNKAKNYEMVKYNINADGSNNAKGFVILIKTPSGIEEIRTWEEVLDLVRNIGGNIPKGTLEDIYKAARGIPIADSDIKYANIDELGNLMRQNFITNGEKMVRTSDNIVLTQKNAYHNGLTTGKVTYKDAKSGILTGEYDVEITDASLFFQYTYKSAANIWNRLSAWQSAFGATSLHNGTTVNYHFNDAHNYKFSIDQGQTYEMTIDEKFEGNNLVKYLTLKTTGQLHGANGVDHTAAAKSASGYQIKLSDVMSIAHPNADIIFTFKTDLNQGDNLLVLEYTSAPQTLVERYALAIKNASTKEDLDAINAQLTQLASEIQYIENTWTGDRLLPSNGISDLSAIQGDKGTFDFTTDKKLIVKFGTMGHAVADTKVLKVGTQGSYHLVGEGIDATFGVTIADTGVLTIQNLHSTGTTAIVMHGLIIKEIEQNPKSSAVIDAYTKAETDAKVKTLENADAALDAKIAGKADTGDSYLKTETYSKTETDDKLKFYERASTEFRPTVTHQAGFIIFDDTGISALPVGSQIKLDMINVNSLTSDPTTLPATGDQTFIGATGAIRIPNTAGTAALKWETKTNATDVNVKDNYKTKLFVVEKKSDTEYDYVRLEDKPSVDLGSVKISAEHTVVGEEAGGATPGTYITAIGAYAGFENQGDNATAVGSGAGGASQSDHATAVGSNSGASHQGQFATAMGAEAGSNKQGDFSVAMGPYAGQFNQPAKSIIINASNASHSPSAENEILMVAGTTSFKVDATKTAIGAHAGETSQGNGAIAIGSSAGISHQGVNATAIGAHAGSVSQGENTVAIGSQAGATNQPNNSIVLNASAASNSPSAENEILFVAGTTTVKINATGIYINGHKVSVGAK